MVVPEEVVGAVLASGAAVAILSSYYNTVLVVVAVIVLIEMDLPLFLAHVHSLDSAVIILSSGTSSRHSLFLRCSFLPLLLLSTAGWTGGKYGVGTRMSIAHTRAIIDAIHSGELEAASYNETPIFHLMVRVI